MRLPLLQGLPFTGARTIVDTRNQPLSGARFVTLFAINNEATPGNVAATLIVGDEELELTPTTLAAFRINPRLVLHRFPIVGEAALSIDADDGVFCFGYMEIEPGESPPCHDVFSGGSSGVAPFMAPTARVWDEDRELHAIADGMQHDVTLVVDVPADYHMELTFYSGEELVLTMPFRGPIATQEIFERIPMVGPCSLRAQLVEGAGELDAVVYGSMVRR